MCDGEKVRHAWIYGGMCEIRPPVYIFIRIQIQSSLEDFLCSSRRNIYIINAGKSVKLLLSGEWLHTHT
jgi:hypothetical protein